MQWDFFPKLIDPSNPNKETSKNKLSSKSTNSNQLIAINKSNLMIQIKKPSGKLSDEKLSERKDLS